ncbi:MAG: hypothetical protein JSW50_07435, partial [Candidatus Latescibacterota bacterium]
MSAFTCIFEDKKFSNFFPLSLSQPVFDLRIGFSSFKTRLRDEAPGEKVGVLCREYLSPLVTLREPELTVNQIPADEAVFVNGRLLCFGTELADLLAKLPGDGIAVKGGYVVAAKLRSEAAQDFAAYIKSRISDETIDQLCEELGSYVTNTAGAAQDKKKRTPVVQQDAREGTYEDDHAVGQDSLAEKLPQQLLKLIDRHNLKRVDLSEAR